jgi:hypothetical protein
MVYKDTEISNTEVIRTFAEDIDPIELMWHRDLETRRVAVVSPSDWKIQLENNLPVSLDETIIIPAGAWHRLIKGSGELVVKIIKEYE